MSLLAVSRVLMVIGLTAGCIAIGCGAGMLLVFFNDRWHRRRTTKADNE